jgi:Ca-activated chloride channel family protein
MARNGRVKNEEGSLVSLRAAAEKSLVRPGGSTRHIDFHVSVGRPKVEEERDPVCLALVIDRSGSMSGGKLQTAKKAALAVLDRLDARDTASITVFDTEIDTILPAGPATPERRARAREALDGIEARSSTALHEGWLTGCRSIASDSPVRDAGRLARCFLLTDGLANVGERDPEKIAEEAAGIRNNAGIGTSTFGIGTDYDEGLLGPLAVAGGGQFHHLRSDAEIAHTFAGELGEIMHVVARNVKLEIEVLGQAALDVVSEYWVTPSQSGAMVLEIGDLMAGEERHVVVRARLSPLQPGSGATVRSRLAWVEGQDRREGEWQEVSFRGAAEAKVDAQSRDRAVLHWMGLHHAARARRLATVAVSRGEAQKALDIIATASRRLGRYAQGDPELETALAGLRDLAQEIEAGRLTAERRHEVRYASQMISRGQRDLR